MDEATKARALAVLTEIQEDLEADNSKWEGQSLTGRNVAVMVAEVRGTIHGLAGVVRKVIEELA